MKRLVLRLLALLLILVATDQVLGAVTRHFFFRTLDGDTGGQVNGLLRSRSRIVVFGSSRAESHYVPLRIEKEFSSSVFNAGFKGSNALYDLAVLRLVLESWTPDLILYDVSGITAANSSTNPYMRLEPVYPYFDHPSVWELIRKTDRFQDLFFRSRLYPYSGKIHSIVIFNLMPARVGSDRGYRPQGGDLGTDPVLPPSSTLPEANHDLVAAMQDFLVTATSHKSRVIVICSPRYRAGPCELPPEVHDVLAKAAVPYLDFDLQAFPQFANPHYFRDVDHLNASGAEAFTAALCDELRHRNLVFY